MNRFGIAIIVLLSCSLLMASTTPNKEKKQRPDSRIQNITTRVEYTGKKTPPSPHPAFVPQSAHATPADLTKINHFPFQTPFADGDDYENAFPVVLDDGSLLVVWTKGYNGDTVYCVKSDDGGRTWSEPWAARAIEPCAGELTGVITPAGRIVAFWRSSGNTSYTMYSDDNGVTWSEPLLIEVAEWYDSYFSLSQTSDGKLWLGWSRYVADGNDYVTIFRTSTDHGTSWSEEQTSLVEEGNSYDVSFVSVDDTTVAVYTTKGNYISRKISTDGGATWTLVASIIPGLSELSYGQRVLRQSDGTLWLLGYWWGIPVPGYGHYDIAWSKSTDNGQTWSAPERFTNYVGANFDLNACLAGNVPFITFSSSRWCTSMGMFHLWYGYAGRSIEGSTPPAVFSFRLESVRVDTAISVAVWANDEMSMSGVKILVNVDGVLLDSIILADDGAHKDSLPSDHIYGGEIGPFHAGESITVYARVSDVDGNSITIKLWNYSFPVVHNVGNLILNIGTWGNLGYWGNGTASGYWPKTDGNNYIYDAGLWLSCKKGGTPRTSVYWYGYGQWDYKEGTHFTSSRGISDQDIALTYTDQWSEPPIGLEVHQQSYQWSDTTRDDFIAFTYTVTNTSGETLDSVRTALWGDVDVSVETDNNRNMVGYDAPRRMMYAYNVDNDPPTYVGFRLLGAGSVPSTVYGWRRGQINESEEPAYYDLMTHGGVTLPDSVGDVRMLLASPAFSLTPSASKEYDFGIVLGRNLADMQRNSDTMAVIFNRLVTSIGDFRTDLRTPREYRLDQNYPNPFNPSTTISFSLPEKSRVTLKIYDLLGRDIATLADETIAAGNYTRVWDAQSMPSGVYFCRLTAGNYSSARKLILLK